MMDWQQSALNDKDKLMFACNNVMAEFPAIGENYESI